MRAGADQRGGRTSFSEASGVKGTRVVMFCLRLSCRLMVPAESRPVVDEFAGAIVVAAATAAKSAHASRHVGRGAMVFSFPPHWGALANQESSTRRLSYAAWSSRGYHHVVCSSTRGTVRCSLGAVQSNIPSASPTFSRSTAGESLTSRSGSESGQIK
jgi:hypothetical protein